MHVKVTEDQTFNSIEDYPDRPGIQKARGEITFNSIKDYRR